VNPADLDHGVTAETVGQLIATVATVVHSESVSRWIVAHAAGITPGALLTKLDDPVSDTAVDGALALAARCQAGEPLQYVLGEWSFRRLEVSVDRRALVPRPETEHVVDIALEELHQLARMTAPVIVADLGTGSGVIALSLALEGSENDTIDLQVWATDASPSALELARVNLGALATSHPSAAARVTVAEGTWFDALPPTLTGRVSLVVSNPPYVSAAEWTGLDPVVRDHEPRTALVPGPTGTEALDVLIDEGRRWLIPGGRLVLEMAPHQAGALRARATAAGYVDVRVRPDLTGRDRTLVATRPHV
jgi:release factor glutamine methyltransferase